MTPAEYSKRALTNDCNYDAIDSRLAYNTEMQRLIHGALGLSGEAGEVTDMIKKHVIYGKDLDVDHLKKECGDVLWYMAVILDAIGSSFEEVMAMNIAKLDARYPNGFTEQAALDRKDLK